MEWTKQKLACYLGDVRTVVEFRGITGDELAQAFESEAMRRLKQIEQIIYDEYLSDQEKVEEIVSLVW